MKNVFLSVLVIGALIVAGVGGTLADFSDSEEELGDLVQAGSLDLKVNGEDDPNILPAAMKGIIPDKSYHIEKVVQNVGTIDGWLYIHIKNVLCTETNDKDLNGDGVIDELDKPEPEVVAEQGGKVGQQMVTGLGERCDMEKHLRVEILWGTAGNMTQVDLSACDKNGDGEVKMDELECEQLLIGQLPECGDEYLIRIGFILQDVLDEDWPGDPKFAYWPTNCYQGDTVTWDILFELLQTDYTPPGG
jgi:hypothetical protein